MQFLLSILSICFLAIQTDGFGSTLLTVRTNGRLWTHQPLSVTQRAPPSAEILSERPLVFLIRDLLSEDECVAYMDKVRELEDRGDRPMTKSNPPEVSIRLDKLWPLPFLSLLAGLPPVLRALVDSGGDLINSDGQVSGMAASASALTIPEYWIQNVLPPIGAAFAFMAVLAFGAVPVIRFFSDESSRTSEALALNQKEDTAFVHDLVDRVAAATDHSWEKWEAPVVTRYAPGAVFAKHGDASPTKGSEWAHLGGQRVVTCITYLNDVADGGETSFDKLGFAVTPKQGTALFFFPADPETLVADDYTTHESLPPQQPKWIVQMFGRVGPRVPPPLGMPTMES